MKVHAIGVVRLTGKKDGRDYDFAQLIHITKIETRTFTSGAVSGAGYESNTLEITLDSFPRFKAIDFPVAGLELELSTTSEMRRNRVQTLVDGFKHPAASPLKTVNS